MLFRSSKGPSASTPVTVYLIWLLALVGFFTVNYLSLGSSSKSSAASSSWLTSSIFIFFISLSKAEVPDAFAPLEDEDETPFFGAGSDFLYDGV